MVVAEGIAFKAGQLTVPVALLATRQRRIELVAYKLVDESHVHLVCQQVGQHNGRPDDDSDAFVLRLETVQVIVRRGLDMAGEVPRVFLAGSEGSPPLLLVCRLALAVGRLQEEHVQLEPLAVEVVALRSKADELKVRLGEGDAHRLARRERETTALDVVACDASGRSLERMGVMVGWVG